MKKIIILIMTALILFSKFPMTSYALSDSESDSIQTLLNDACSISGVPGMSMTILEDDDVFYFSSGYEDREKRVLASENTLYELASVSKAFTGMGILLMEEKGMLSMNDSIQKYLPWFTLKYQGKPVDMQNITLNNFLHHTSGLTNSGHSQYIPQGNTPDMLRKTVEMLSGTELSFYPGEQCRYGTVNYDVLGLVMETVSGQSYEDYMKEQVLQPLGLHQTYVYKTEAEATGELAQGYRSSFFMTVPYDAPDFAGNKPAGYIISCTKDMARWMNIQMGAVQDIPEIFHKVIKKSHQGNLSVTDDNGMFYGAGWYVNSDQSYLEHPGGNPNFSTKVLLLPKKNIAICLLTNGVNTNTDLVKQVEEILEGKQSQSYKISSSQLLDIALSSATIICGLFAGLFFLLGLHRKNRYYRQKMTQKGRITTACCLVITVLIWGIPLLIGNRWSIILVWQTYSILTAILSLALLTTCITWYLYIANTTRLKDD